jgi:hypothetical protein
MPHAKTSTLKGRKSRSRTRKKAKPSWETFTFAVEHWTYDYGLSLHPDYLKYRHQELCDEHYSIFVEGPLVFSTKRKVEGVKLHVYGKDFKPKEWDERDTSIGAVLSTRGGTVSAAVWIPTSSFPSLLLGLSAGKVQGAEILVHDLFRGSGRIGRFSTMQPEEWLEEPDLME